MQLIGLLDSPYVRRCAVSMALFGIAFEHRAVSVFRHMDTFKAINPLIKAPTLVCDDGTVLHDSNLILQYVEALAAPKTLWPRDVPTLAAALRITANALVAMEKAVQCMHQLHQRRAEKPHQPWFASSPSNCSPRTICLRQARQKQATRTASARRSRKRISASPSPGASPNLLNPTG